MSARFGPGDVTIVVAHPDDEILWLSSAVASAERIVFCFGDPFERPRLAAARRRAVAALHLPQLLDLALPESGAGFSVDRTNGRLTDFGIEIVEPLARARYEARFSELVTALRGALVGVRTVLSHNPWGEYGHAEHIQVYRALRSVQSELGFTLWFSNYVGALSWPLAQRLREAPCWTDRRTVRPDAALARRIMRIYRRHGAWTWTRWHRWPAVQSLYAQLPEGGLAHERPLAGEMLLDVAGLRPWPTPWRRASRLLR